MGLPAGIRAVLTDIEGTTTPVAFVYETLFPFAEARLEAYCERAEDDPRIAGALELLRRERDEESSRSPQRLPAAAAAYARLLMASDRKSTGLKALQGLIWEDGYRQGTLRATVYADVAACLASWQDAGIALRVFSSGSVLAQRLLFGHTEYGDLTARFEGFHDTTTGPKQDPRSYGLIAAEFDRPAGEILFLSDVIAELDAARDAGMRTALVVRPGNRPVASGEHPACGSFEDLARI